MEIRTYTTATTERSTYYCIGYAVILGIISLAAAMLFHWVTTEYIPFRPIVWIGENLSLLFGLAVFALLAFPLYKKVDRSSTLNVTRVFTNSVHNKQNGICYGMGWNIGNLLEKLQGEFKSFILKDSTDEDKPLEVKSEDDTPRIWGTLVIRAVDARVLNYGTTKEDILEQVKPIFWASVKALIEQFTANKKNEAILGHAEEISAAVNARLMSLQQTRDSGFNLSWVTGNIDESKKAAEARKGLLTARLFAEGVSLLQTDPNEMYDSNGQLKKGALTREEATAALLAKEGNGSFKRDLEEKVIRIEGDPQAIAIARETGMLWGVAGGAHHPAAHQTSTP